MPRARKQEPLGTRNAIHDELWSRGCLRYKLRPHGQTDAYDFVKLWKHLNPNDIGPVILNCHRRFGKSYLTIILALERALAAPRSIVRVVAPTKEQGVGIFRDQWSDIIRDCPAFIDHKPVEEEVRIFNQNWNAKDDMADSKLDYSILSFHGAEFRGGALMRGVGADLIILDELGFMTDPESLLKNILIWQTKDRPGAMMVGISTPPKTADHYLAETLIPDAITGARYFEMPYSRNEDVGHEDEASLVRLCGSKDSVAWLREAECQILSDPGAQILPEWTRIENKCAMKYQPNPLLIDLDEYKMPEYFIPRTAFDLGGTLDPTGVLFWTWDFTAKKMLVLKEMLLRDTHLADVAAKIKATEAALWEKTPMYRELVRHGDMRPREWQDLRELFGLESIIVDPRDRQIATEKLNSEIAAGNVLISKDCTELLYQMRNGVYKSATNQNQFVRTKRLGHCDLLAALVVAHRQSDRLKHWDPRPEKKTYTGETYGHLWEPEDGAMRVLETRSYEF